VAFGTLVELALVEAAVIVFTLGTDRVQARKGAASDFHFLAGATFVG